MVKLKKQKIHDVNNKRFLLKYISIITLFLVVMALFSGCEDAPPIINSPTPLPSYTPAPTVTPADDMLNQAGSNLSTSSNATPLYDTGYPVPEIIGNTGANIENSGLSTSDKNKIYYIDNGIWCMNKDGSNAEQIIDMHNISCLNDVGDYIYFLSSHDGSVYRVEKIVNAVPEFLNITGADSLVVLGDYMYYCLAIGENATNYIYKSPLQGTMQECLFVKATNITPDGAYFYFNNLEDDGNLWRYDTISSQIVKILNDKASQLNIIEDKLYYISKNTDYNVVSVDRNGLNPVVVVTQGCTDLNIIQNYLIYRTIDTGYIQSYNIKTGDKVSLISYGKLFSLSATGTMIFFQSCPADGFEPETYIFDIVTSQLNKDLPQNVYAFVKDIRLDDLTFDYDIVDFYEGEEAIVQYSNYNGTTQEEAKQAILTDDGTYFIYNRNQAWIRTQSQDWTNITLIRRATSLGNSTPYTASLNEVENLFNNNPGIEGKLLFELTIVDKKVVAMNEVYYTIDTEN